MSSERELDEGIKSIKSAWRREHTARANLEKMLQQAETENAKLFQQLADVTESMGRVEERCAKLREQVDYMTPLALYEASERERDRMRELGIEVD